MNGFGDSQALATPAAGSTKPLFKVEMCKYFQLGTCKNGLNCTFAHDEAEIAGTNLYIKGLPLGISEEQLMSILSPYGTISSIKVLPTTKDNTPALVRFLNYNEAEWVVQNLNGNVPQGLESPIAVKFAATDAEKSSGYGKASFKGMGNENSPYGGKGAPPFGGIAMQSPVPQKAPPEPNTNLYVKGLPMGITEEQVLSIFGAYGTVSSVRVLPTSKDNTPALIRFEKSDEARWVLETLNNNVPEGLQYPVTIKLADRTPGKGGASQGGGKGNQDMGGMMQMMQGMMGKGNGNGGNMNEMMSTMESMMNMMQGMLDSKGKGKGQW
eukprot:gnl/TRDRNA2_/TRDRNA2_176144_c6_seq2.p1 gnl/TRDRNA2_/TRDRNA2_176144_c6~~gnl/TRDRNA2_/TRDRNA2_176144_c6_seq2.p1  ORF type:complete len:359 (+),score=66.29 gnl/TRDRNA2_/TRDRNA2_176144_c6_seq2:103-1077(+)